MVAFLLQKLVLYENCLVVFSSEWMLLSSIFLFLQWFFGIAFCPGLLVFNSADCLLYYRNNPVFKNQNGGLLVFTEVQSYALISGGEYQNYLISFICYKKKRLLMAWDVSILFWKIPNDI